MYRQTNKTRRGRGLLRGAAALAAAAAFAGCEGILDVENPNQLVQDDLETPAAARALANGAVSTVARAYSRIMLRHDVASDELVFVGSRDAWLQLQRGQLRDRSNEFLDAGPDGMWDWVTEGRWMADEAIRILTGFEAEGLLSNPLHLARAQLYSAVLYTLIADVYEDFIFSDRMEAAPPIGPENMVGLYDTAIQNLDGALSRAQAVGDAETEARVMAQRARTKHARAVWNLLNPPGSVPANPLVNDAGAVADARAALDLADGPEWRFLHRYSAATVTNNYGAWMNERLEHRVSDAYVVATADDKKVASIRLRDPIDDIPDPALTARIREIHGDEGDVRAFGPITVTGAREMRLILAEAALAADDVPGFAEHMNAVRALDGLTPWNPLVPQIPALDMLKHARRVNLFNQGRRLNDHYRFGEPSFMWDSAQEAVTRPGTKFPITITECRSNEHLFGRC